MNIKTSPFLAALLLTLAACGGDSGNPSDGAPAPVVDPTQPTPTNDPNVNPGFSNDPVTVNNPETADPAPVEPTPVQQPETNVPEPEQNPPVVQPPTEPTQPVIQPEPTQPEPDLPPQPVMQDPQDTAGCVVPAAGSTVVSQTTPVKENDNPFYYPSMGPQCVSPPSQFDGPGLAYGDFLLTNNAWNGQQSTWNWQQCIALTAAADGSILPSWSFDWGNEDDLQPGLFEWEVKSYPEIIYGYKSNQEISAPCSNTGLPAKVQNLPNYSIGYSYRAPLTDNRIGDRGDESSNPPTVTGGDRNVAIESFFHNSCDITRGASTNMELELMVWLEMGNERLPSGQPPSTIQKATRVPTALKHFRTTGAWPTLYSGLKSGGEKAV